VNAVSKSVSPLHQLVNGARIHEAIPVPLSRRLRWSLWLLIALDVTCAVVHRTLLQPWASGFIGDVLSWGGRWTLVTGAMLAAAFGLALIGVATDGFRAGTSLHLRITVTLILLSVASAGPVVVFGAVAAVLAAIVMVVLSLLIGGLLAGAVGG
jgi:hypothetical protein